MDNKIAKRTPDAIPGLPNHIGPGVASSGASKKR